MQSSKLFASSWTLRKTRAMKRTPTLLALALAVAIGGSLIAATGLPRPATHLDFEVDLAPLDDASDSYRCQATFRDLETGEVFSAPQVVFRKGSEARMATGIPGTGRQAVLTVHVSEAGTATYELHVQDAERLISRHRATVALDS
jgi:hypothetical protein